MVRGGQYLLPMISFGLAKPMMSMLLAALLCLAGCATVPVEGLDKDENTIKAAPTAADIARDSDFFRSFLAGTTIRSYDAQNGNQIEFIAKDGTVRLWYPGNAALVPGRWITEPLNIRGATQICFQYGTDTFNPVMQERGGNWECQGAGNWLARLSEIRNGDPLNLRRRLPFRLENHPEQSISDLVRGADLPVPKNTNLATWSQSCCLE